LRFVQAALARDSATWNSAAAGEMCGSRPEAELVTRSIAPERRGCSAWQFLHIAFDAFDQFLFVGPRFDPEDAPAS